MDYKTLNTGKENFQYIHTGKGSSILFLHGFGVPPQYYHRMIEEVAEDHEVIAPKIYGMNYFTTQPTNHKECVEKTLDFVNQLKLDEHNVTGHSIGGSVGLEYLNQNDLAEKLVSINPILPNNNTTPSFIRRAIWKGIREATGRTGGVEGFIFGHKIPIPFTYNLLKNTKASFSLIKSICEYELPATTKPVKFMLGEQDEYFDDGEKQIKHIQEIIPHAEISIESNSNHDWPIFKPTLGTIGAELFFNK